MTQLLTMTTTHKFPPLASEQLGEASADVEKDNADQAVTDEKTKEEGDKGIAKAKISARDVKQKKSGAHNLALCITNQSILCRFHIKTQIFH